jgi:hypothetical protein
LGAVVSLTRGGNDAEASDVGSSSTAHDPFDELRIALELRWVLFEMVKICKIDI